MTKPQDSLSTSAISKAINGKSTRPSCEAHGFLAKHLGPIQTLADKLQLIIIISGASSDALPFIEKGFPTKTLNISRPVSNKGPFAGVVPFELKLSRQTKTGIYSGNFSKQPAKAIELNSMPLILPVDLAKVRTKNTSFKIAGLTTEEAEKYITIQEKFPDEPLCKIIHADEPTNTPLIEQLNGLFYTSDYDGFAILYKMKTSTLSDSKTRTDFEIAAETQFELYGNVDTENNKEMDAIWKLIKKLKASDELNTLHPEIITLLNNIEPEDLSNKGCITLLELGIIVTLNKAFNQKMLNHGFEARNPNKAGSYISAETGFIICTPFEAVAKTQFVKGDMVFGHISTLIKAGWECHPHPSWKIKSPTLFEAVTKKKNNPQALSTSASESAIKKRRPRLLKTSKSFLENTTKKKTGAKTRFSQSPPVTPRSTINYGHKP